ncbi:MAG: arylamine N-acetyltransferase [Desulfuromonadales bacterium]
MGVVKTAGELINIEACLKRLGVRSLPDTPLPRLQTLHRAMTRTVPFENMAILEGQSISLDPKAIFTKIVEQGRGGYCFELNTLLAEILEFFNYAVERRLGRVWVTGATAPLPTHMALKVKVENRSYLCDVGFGGSTLREPLPWNTGSIVNQAPDSYRLDETENAETMLSGSIGPSWKNLYSLLPCTVRSQDYIPANHYTSTHPDSFFTREPMAALATEDGRITLHGRMFRRTGAAGKTERELANLEELVQVLSREFGLTHLNVKALESRLSGLFVNIAGKGDK